MRLFVALASLAALSVVQANGLSSIHLRVHHRGSACTITNESQCDGQNWTGSTCCADANYECRWDDNGGDVKRCQKIVTDDDVDTDDSGGEEESASESEDSEDNESEEDENVSGGDEECNITNESQCDGQNWTGSTCCADPNYECRWDDDGADVMRCQAIEVMEDRHHHKQHASKKTSRHQKRHQKRNQKHHN